MEKKQEVNNYIRFLQYDLLRDQLVNQMKDFLFTNAVENIEPDLHELIKEISDQAAKGKTVNIEMKTEVGEKGGVVFKFKYDVL